MNRPDYQSVGKSVRKKDSLQLLLGKPVFTEDIAPDALVVKLLRSPHANAIVEDIDTSKAKKVAGVVDVYTWEDVPGERFSNAGQTYPETSPYDRLIIDRHVRYVGDVVAIVAAENEKAAEAALSRIKVTYEVLDPVLDFRAAKDNPTLVHPEDNWHMLCDLGGDNKRNLVGTTADADGDVEAVLADCDIVLERTYHTKAFNQAMMAAAATPGVEVVTGTNLPMLLETLSTRMPDSSVDELVECALGAGKMGVDHKKLEVADDSDDDDLFGEEDGL